MKLSVPTITILVILATFMVGPCIAFQTTVSVRTSHIATTRVQSFPCEKSLITKLASKMDASDDEGDLLVVEEDDDGWGTSATSDFDEKTKELRALQNSRQAAPPSRTQGTSEGERDLFIPIFAVVSLLGLFGSYGYEMMRLASRGELYLPWNN